MAVVTLSRFCENLHVLMRSYGTEGASVIDTSFVQSLRWNLGLLGMVGGLEGIYLEHHSVAMFLEKTLRD